MTDVLKLTKKVPGYSVQLYFVAGCIVWLSIIVLRKTRHASLSLLVEGAERILLMDKSCVAVLQKAMQHWET